MPKSSRKVEHQSYRSFWMAGSSRIFSWTVIQRPGPQSCQQPPRLGGRPRAGTIFGFSAEVNIRQDVPKMSIFENWRGRRSSPPTIPTSLILISAPALFCCCSSPQGPIPSTRWDGKEMGGGGRGHRGAPGMPRDSTASLFNFRCSLQVFYGASSV